MKKTVVFDFDGVIHSYKSGWRGVALMIVVTDLKIMIIGKDDKNDRNNF